jgi:hypothetical protein
LRRDVKKHLGTEMKRKRIINCFPEGKSRWKNGYEIKIRKRHEIIERSHLIVLLTWQARPRQLIISEVSQHPIFYSHDISLKRDLFVGSSRMTFPCWYSTVRKASKSSIASPYHIESSCWLDAIHHTNRKHRCKIRKAGRGSQSRWTVSIPEDESNSVPELRCLGLNIGIQNWIAIVNGSEKRTSRTDSDWRMRFWDHVGSCPLRIESSGMKRTFIEWNAKRIPMSFSIHRKRTLGLSPNYGK